MENGIILLGNMVKHLKKWSILTQIVNESVSKKSFFFKLLF